MTGRTDDALPELMRVGAWHVRPREGVIERDSTVVAYEALRQINL